MRLTRLMLHAFGPFTEMELDLNGEEARPSGGLHLIYGPNEAGKSATLRALTDLRFGIPVRSTDNFIHAYGDMCIAGIFETAEGERVGLRRTKGRKNTLTKFAPSTIDGAPAGTEWETALTGALSRNDFEAMYGLNHARLREGGDRLIKGEGELGSALFEASAGTRGIGAILSRLDEDARNLFSQRAKNAVVNEARRALEEHRKNFKEAITRPREWEEVNRSNEQAQEGLAKVDNALEDTIRRQRDLTELRTVAPMLLELDQVRSELEEAKDAPELPEDARQRRLSAEQARHRANADLLQADADIAACIEALAGLNIETHLLERAEAIERLSNRVDAVESARVTIRQLESEIEQDASSLQLEAGRIAPSQDPATVLAAIPSAAERVQLDEHLAAITKLTERLAGDQERVQALSEAAAMEDADFPPPPSSKLREDLTDTMRHARGLGDTVQRHNDLRREHFQVEGELSQVLRDLGVDSIEALRASRPLMDAQISDARATRTALDQAKRECHLEQQRLREDTDKQRQRQGELAAQGEVVTAETVALARQHRDTGWRLIRQAYAQWGADKSFVSEGYDPKQPLLDAFEEAQRDADRKADLLRADTSRAANYADCTQRIDQMLRRQKALENELGSLSADGQANTGDWVCLLLESSLPELTPDALREWQAERKRGLSLAGRVNVLAQQTETLIKAEQAACDAIAAALRALGEPPRTTALSEFVDHAARWADADTKLAGKRQERARVIEKRRDDQEQLTARIAKHTVELGEHQTLASKWRGVLYLSPDSSFTSVKARLDELDALNKQAQALSHVRRELRGHQALVGEFNDQVKQMAELLGDTNPQLATEYASRLQVRL
ncbi:MAG: AAA family ATPase, partial [Chromatiales bacterium]|nr:AAA family ATPase [Chromatiales bacterium]